MSPRVMLSRTRNQTIWQLKKHAGVGRQRARRLDYTQSDLPNGVSMFAPYLLPRGKTQKRYSSQKTLDSQQTFTEHGPREDNN